MEGRTAQEAFWRGSFGDAYTERNAGDAGHLRACTALWASILSHLAGAPPRRILEVGANIGYNLRALRNLTDAELFAVEPNASARRVLADDGVVPPANVRDGVAAAIGLPDAAVDLAFTSGVLIHIHPDDLLAACREIHRVAGRHVACIEYFADKPEEVAYRGHRDRLFKRDFGAFWLDHFPDLRVVACGFAWERMTGLGNLTWWLFAKHA